MSVSAAAAAAAPEPTSRSLPPASSSRPWRWSRSGRHGRRNRRQRLRRGIRHDARGGCRVIDDRKGLGVAAIAGRDRRRVHRLRRHRRDFHLLLVRRRCDRLRDRRLRGSDRDRWRIGHAPRARRRLQAQALSRIDRVGRTDVVPGRQIAKIEFVAERDAVQRVAARHRVVRRRARGLCRRYRLAATRNRRFLRFHRHTRLEARATREQHDRDEQGTQTHTHALQKNSTITPTTSKVSAVQPTGSM